MFSRDLPMVLAKLLEKQSDQLLNEGLIIEAAIARVEARQLKILSHVDG